MSDTDKLVGTLCEHVSDHDDLIDCEERSRLVTLATEDAIWDWDLKTDGVKRSSKFSKFGHCDWESDPTISWWQRHLHPDDRDAAVGTFNWAIKNRKKFISLEYRFCKADGSFAYIFDRAFIMHDADGVPVRAIGAMVDVTELRLVKQLLRQTENQLAFVSRQGAMGTMGSMIAHELSQPLASVANYIRACRHMSLTAESTDFDRLHEALEAAEANAIRAGDIIRRLRELVTRGGVDQREQTVSQLIEDSCSVGLGEGEAAGISIKTTVEPSDLSVWVDRIQVQQVIINLVRNSIEALQSTPAPEIKIQAIKSGNFAQVSIEDNGAGIPEDVREGIFAAIMTTKAAGMGIGLSISRTIIEAQGGEIWLVSSREGHTVFRFTLPLISSTTGEG